MSPRLDTNRARVCVEACAGMENPPHAIRLLRAESSHLQGYRSAFAALVERSETFLNSVRAAAEELPEDHPVRVKLTAAITVADVRTTPPEKPL